MIQPPAAPDWQINFNVRNFGALGDARTLDPAAFQAVIDACYARGGGTVWVSAGQYVIGTIFFHDNISLHLEAGAILLGSLDPADYPVLPNRWQGVQQPTYAPLIAGENLKNIALVGRGTINGRGEPRWQACQQKSLAYPRPRLFGFTACDNILIENITLINSPSWTINPVRGHNVRIHGVTIKNPPDSPYTDGINPDSCSLVHISDCFVSVGDDCITLKAGTEQEHAGLNAPCRDISITNCILERGHGGVVNGSETTGCAKCGHLQLRIHRRRSRHPHEIPARAGWHRRKCVNFQPDYGWRVVPIHDKPLLRLQCLGKYIYLRQSR